MEAWLAPFDKACRALQNADRPGELEKALKGAPFPIDWTPEDVANAADRPCLYRRDADEGPAVNSPLCGSVCPCLP